MAASNSGLAGLEKFARLLSDPKDKRGWPSQFPAGLPLYKGLTGIFRAIEVDGAGGALRPLYAQFLDEAASLLDKPALQAVADRYRTIGKAWTSLAEAALPRSAPLLAQARSLLAARRDAFNSRGASAADDLRTIDSRLNDLQAQAPTRFPLDAADVRTLLEGLSRDALEIVAQERQAASALQAALT